MIPSGEVKTSEAALLYVEQIREATTIDILLLKCQDDHVARNGG